MKPTVAVPVETKVRELFGYLLLSLELVQRGYHVAFGRMDQLNEALDIIEPDVYLGGGLSNRPLEVDFCRRLNRANISLVVLPTEGGVFPSDEWFSEQISVEAWGSASRFMAWGDRTRDLVSRLVPERDQDCLTTGTPLLDPTDARWRGIFATKGRDLKSQLGNYILINTNFGEANHRNREKTEAYLRDERMHEYLAYGKRMIPEFLNMAEELARRFPDREVVIRPHPSESLAPYLERTEGTANITVRNDGSVCQWISECQAMVHINCTTAIEAFLMQKPVFAFRPFASSQIENSVANGVSTIVNTVDQLYGHLASPRPPEPVERQRKARELRPLFGALDGQAYRRVADVIGAVVASRRGPPSLAPLSALARTKRFLKASFPQAVSLLGTSRSRRSRSYTDAKFPELTRSELLAGIAALREQEPSFGGPELSVSSIRYCRDCYLLAKDQ